MNKEFITYEQALELKELGYNPIGIPKDVTSQGIVYKISFSQAFRFFRENHKIHSVVEITIESQWYYSIYNLNAKRNAEIECEELYYDTYEDAELECLNKLIQIVKQK
jgi:hypothetical protein